MARKKNIVVIGGGTGTSAVLEGLKEYPVNLSVIITMADSGGSSGRLRKELGVLPPGDARQCLYAMARSNTSLKNLLPLRFSRGSLRGHSLGNVLLAAGEILYGDFQQAVDSLAEALGVEGNVIPVTLSRVMLRAEFIDGKSLEGEHYIKHSAAMRKKLKRLYLYPRPTANKKALYAIKRADVIVVGPGDLFGSVLPVLLVPQISKAVKGARAKKIFVCNLMNRFASTRGFWGEEFVRYLEKYSGRPDYILTNKKPFSASFLASHKEEGEPIKFSPQAKVNGEIVARDILDTRLSPQSQDDLIPRALIRHHPHKLAKVIMEFV